MLDYFYNIKKNAPFNMWPHMLKFNLCNPKIIYRSKISIEGTISTIHFDNENPLIEPFNNLLQYSKSKNLTAKTLANLCEEFNLPISYNAKDVLTRIESFSSTSDISNDLLIHKFANAFYREALTKAIENLNAIGRTIPSVFDYYIQAL